MTVNNDVLEELMIKELKSLKDFHEKIKDDHYLGKIEIDYIHFLDLFIDKFSREDILAKLIEIYDRGLITAVRSPQNLLFEIKIK